MHRKKCFRRYYIRTYAHTERDIAAGFPLTKFYHPSDAFEYVYPCCREVGNNLWVLEELQSCRPAETQHENRQNCGTAEW